MHKSNWDDYRFIIAVMEEGSLNAASRRLGVNHATVLRRVTAFEERHGVQLFERHKTGYRITATRANFAEALAGVRNAVEAAHRAVQGQDQAMHGSVKITSTDSLCESVLPGIMTGLQAEHPELQLELLSTNFRLNLARLDAEISVRPALGLPDELIGTEACKLVFKVYGSWEYLDQNRAQKDVKWLAPTADSGRSPPSRWIKENVLPEQVVFRADSFLSLRGMARAGLGLTFLPCCIVQPADNLVTPEGLDVRLDTRLWVASHQDLDELPRVRACKEFLVARLVVAKDVLEGRTPMS
ncbi:MAG: LysR family transcriptional regulator [Rhodobacteraceae bacterium]|nr:LysR family transcriptional regulator [Paracoccaceae bacterium]